MSDHRRFIYRGGSVGDVAGELERGSVSGTTSTVLLGDYPEDPSPTPSEVTFADVGIDDAPFTEREVSVVGGFTDDLEQTRRFRGARGVVMVFDTETAGPTPEPIQYEFGWMNANEGVLSHVHTIPDGEIRRANGDLWGLFTNRPRVDGSTYRVVTQSGGRGELPATAPESRFAEEREWVLVGSDTLSLTGRLSAVVAIAMDNGMVPLGEFWEDTRERISAPLDVYAIAVDGEYGGVWTDNVIDAIGPGGGHMDPLDVPPAFRGGDTLGGGS